MSYKAFAQFYDILTDNVDYTAGCDYISGFFSRYGNGGVRLLDLACGTGTISKIFADKGFDVTGIDLSEDMLTAAEEKCNGSVRLLKGDISDFNLAEKFDICICTLDSINHLENIDAVKSSFNCVRNSLADDGLFIFDVNTIYKHREVLADNTFVFDEEDFFLSWDNECENNTVRILLDIFVFNGKSYDRYSEEFFETAYAADEITQALDGFEIIGIYDNLSENPPHSESERIFFVCKRK